MRVTEGWIRERPRAVGGACVVYDLSSGGQVTSIKSAEMETMQYWETYSTDHREGRRVDRARAGRPRQGPGRGRYLGRRSQEGGCSAHRTGQPTEAERPSPHLFAPEPRLAAGDAHVGRPREAESVGHIALSSGDSSRMVRVRLRRPRGTGKRAAGDAGAGPRMGRDRDDWRGSLIPEVSVCGVDLAYAWRRGWQASIPRTRVLGLHLRVGRPPPATT